MWKLVKDKMIILNLQIKSYEIEKYKTTLGFPAATIVSGRRPPPTPPRGMP
jgi:hypothetical protein